MITIKQISITSLHTDAIVNAANSGLFPGGGVCGAIFQTAGYDELEKACSAIGQCPTGSAVITPGFALSKYIIHAVGPIWRGGTSNEPALLYSAYCSALQLAEDNGCRSVGFPLISAGIYGYPVDQAWDVALQACSTFPDMNILFAVLDERILSMGQQKLETLHV